MMRFLHRLLSTCCLVVCLGCEAKPFEVISPTIEPDLGAALISASIPSFTRGLIQRVELKVSSADTSRMRAVTRSMNFPIPGGNLSTGQVADIPVGLRRFGVQAFDTEGVLRFRGFTDSLVMHNQTRLVTVPLERVGGAINFIATIDPSAVDTTVVDSAGLASLPATSILDVLELVEGAPHPGLSLLPIFSVGLGERFSTDEDGLFSRQVLVERIPTGTRVFAAHLRDLSSGGTLAFADTLVVAVDTLRTAQGRFELELVRDPATISAIFTKDTLPPDSSVVVITPQF